MKVNNPNLSPAANLNGPSGVQETGRTPATGSNGGVSSTTGTSGDDVHLSELVRSLRSLAADSPARQANLEQIARTYDQGSYQVNTQGTASKLVEDALQQHA
jgi:anti-sigma28 factor (negative regulator of flagellin synthesis)